MNIPIVTITRIGLNVLNRSWHLGKIKFLSHLTIPSISAQSRDSVYHLFLIDRRVDGEVYECYRKALEPVRQRAHLISVDTLCENISLSAGSYHWICRQIYEKLFSLGILAHPDQLFVSISLDDDDALAIDFFDKVLEVTRKKYTAMSNKVLVKSHLKHGLVGCLFSFDDGYSWNASTGRFALLSQRHLMNALLTSSVSGLTVMSLSHLNWRLAKELFGFDCVYVSGYRGWIYTRDLQAFSTTRFEESEGDSAGLEEEVFRSFAVDKDFILGHRPLVNDKTLRHQRLRRAKMLKLAIVQQKIVSYKRFLSCCPPGGPYRAVSEELDGLIDEYYNTY
jgi:hypothetical protein